MILKGWKETKKTCSLWVHGFHLRKTININIIKKEILRTKKEKKIPKESSEFIVSMKYLKLKKKMGNKK